ncbi:hypothetical protein [Nonlabens sp. MB-3u-79]|uniref:hypothetical protein n=1 Tax=Nonlabens sp. MB-3u-79 TaxID=2058134 RepID=UPI0012FD736C|nr:hypothetical protein [Nonlabens sp. MB-3u-79]
MKIYHNLRTATLQIFTSYGVCVCGATVGNNGYNSLQVKSLPMAVSDWIYSRSPFERLMKTVVCKKNRPQIK